MFDFGRLCIAASAAAAVLLAMPALANDSSASLKAGGLTLTKTNAVEMRSEDLFISEKSVVVTYKFRNVTNAPVTLDIAFPMPDLAPSESDIGAPFPERDNFLGFSTTVDGRPINFQIIQTAHRIDDNGDVLEDVTALLRSKRIPLNPYAPTVNAALNRLPAADRAALAKAGLTSEFGVRWLLRQNYVRRQTFPVGRDVTVVHRYTPAAGGSVGSMAVMFAQGGVAATEDDGYFAKSYCLDDSMLTALRRVGERNGGAAETTIDYVLQTGANWAGPIRDFRLVVDKGAPGNLVSFCMDGVTKISPTRFEVRRTNFTPTEDLAILIVKPYTAR
jgi:hypothetical protein